MDIHHIDDFKGGWFVGGFEPTLLHSKDVEVGWKVHHRDEGVVPHVHHKVTEYNLLAHGSMTVNGQRLEAGQMFILHPGERVDVEIHTEEVHVVCVKSPSIPEDKEICAPS